MKKYNITLTIIAIAISLVSCEEEIGEIKFNEESLITVNALFEAEADTNAVYLSMTGASCTTSLHHAEVNVYVNDKLVETSTSDNNKYIILTRFTAGDKVKLEVTSDSLKKQVNATCIVPAPVKTCDITTTLVNKKYQDATETQRRTFIDIESPTTDKSFYRLTVNDDILSYGFNTYYDSFGTHGYHGIKRQHNTTYTYPSDIAMNDGNIYSDSMDSDDYIGWYSSSPNKYGIFKSSYFENGRYTLKIDTWTTDSRLNSFVTLLDWLRHTKFTIRSITSDEYYYILGIEAISDYEASGFMNNAPIIHSNINGGTGIFSISTSTSTTIDECHLVKLTREKLYEIDEKYPGDIVQLTQDGELYEPENPFTEEEYL